MTREEMLEKLEILVKSAANLDDAARDYERQGQRQALETIENEGRVCMRMAGDLQDWHR